MNSFFSIIMFLEPLLFGHLNSRVISVKIWQIFNLYHFVMNKAKNFLLKQKILKIHNFSLQRNRILKDETFRNTFFRIFFRWREHKIFWYIAKRCKHSDTCFLIKRWNRNETKRNETKRRKNNSTTCCCSDDVLPECLNSSSHSSIFRVENDEIEPTKQNFEYSPQGSNDNLRFPTGSSDTRLHRNTEHRLIGKETRNHESWLKIAARRGWRRDPSKFTE